MSKECLNVFVYGTLKINEPNHYWLSNENNGKAKFIGEGTTQEKYPLVIATKYNIPFLLDKPGYGNCVAGEIYGIDIKMLANLDILEDYPNFYQRKILKININSEILDCWVYSIKKFQPELLAKEMLVSYSSEGEHGLKYLERYLRDPSYDIKSNIY